MSGLRYGAALLAVLAFVSAGFAYQANQRLTAATEAAVESREATFHTYRIAQMIQSLIHGYVLTINEYYSTALKYPDYAEKAGQFKVAIDRELLALENLKTGDAGTVAALKEALREVEGMRVELERALASEDRDWDLAREALYKLTVVSVRATQPSELLASVAEQKAGAQDAVMSEQQSQAQVAMRIALLLALGAGVLATVGFFRVQRNTPHSGNGLA